jgi:hypothetical protein
LTGKARKALRNAIEQFSVYFDRRINGNASGPAGLFKKRLTCSIGTA